MLSQQQIDMQIRIALLERLPAIIAESVKPIQNIDGIKILQVGGNGAGMLGGATHAAAQDRGMSNGNSGTSGTSGNSLADDMVSSALRYRSQAPLIDHLLSELGLAGGGDMNALTSALVDSQFSPLNNKPTANTPSSTQTTPEYPKPVTTLNNREPNIDRIQKMQMPVTVNKKD